MNWSVFEFVWPTPDLTASISALPGEEGSNLSNLERATVVVLMMLTLLDLSALKYSSSAILADLTVPDFAR